MKSEELRHQDDSSQPSMKIFFLDIGILATIFGHKAKDYKFYGRIAQAINGSLYINFEFYICHNYGHMERECRTKMDVNTKC